MDIQNILHQNERSLYYLKLLEDLGLHNVTSFNAGEVKDLYLAGFDLGLSYYQFLIKIKDDTEEITKLDLDNLRSISNIRVNKGLIITNGIISREAKKARVERNQFTIDILDNLI